MTKEQLLEKHIQKKSHLHLTVDEDLVVKLTKLIPSRKRSQFVESLIQKELARLDS
jgi:hypothetical protein